MKLAKYVKFREEKLGGVLFETRSEKVFTLNPTATAVIREIAKGDEATIASRLKDCFDDQGGAIEREAPPFLAERRRRGLIEGGRRDRGAPRRGRGSRRAALRRLADHQ